MGLAGSVVVTAMREPRSTYVSIQLAKLFTYQRVIVDVDIEY